MKDKTTGEPQLHDCSWTTHILSVAMYQLHRCTQQIRTQTADSEVALRDGNEATERGCLTPQKLIAKLHQIITSDNKFNNSPKPNKV